MVVFAPGLDKRRLLPRVVNCVAGVAALVPDVASGAWMDEAHACLEIPQFNHMLDLVDGERKVTISEAEGQLCAFGEDGYRLVARLPRVSKMRNA